MHQVRKLVVRDIVAGHQPALEGCENFYKYLHQHPELSQNEARTAKVLTEGLRRFGFEVIPNIGGHGVVGLLRSGLGKVVLLRADMDALPIEEKTDLPYQSTQRMIDTDGIEKPVMHACGHDMHMTALLAAAELLAKSKKEWSGTLIVLFQPSEERGSGARAMVDDGLYERVPKPDVVLGGHVWPGLSGTVITRPGVIMAAADSFKITLRGRGGHGAEPHRTIDPVVLAASVVLRLQTIVSREVDPLQSAVVTVASVQAGNAENVIPEEAILKVNIRTFDEGVREKILAALRRIIKAECDASAAPEPIVEPITQFPLLRNDETATAKLSDAFTDYFGDSFDKDAKRASGSEDFGILGSAIGVPTCFWFYGGVGAEKWKDAVRKGKINEIPGNHNDRFAPDIEPTLKTAMHAYAVAALTWLCNS